MSFVSVMETIGKGFAKGLKWAAEYAVPVEKPDAADRESCKPDFMVLAYPVITMSSEYAHSFSRENLLGKDAPKELIEELSMETRVTAETPPGTSVTVTALTPGTSPSSAVTARVQCSQVMPVTW